MRQTTRCHKCNALISKRHPEHRCRPSGCVTPCVGCKALVPAILGVLERRCPDCFKRHLAELRRSSK